MISLILDAAEALAVHRALDREARMFGQGTPNHDMAVAIAARLAPAIIAEEQVKAVERVADQTSQGMGI